MVVVAHRPIRPRYSFELRIAILSFLPTQNQVESYSFREGTYDDLW